MMFWLGFRFFLFRAGEGGENILFFIFFDTFSDLAYTSTQNKNKMSDGYFWAGGETPTAFLDLCIKPFNLGDGNPDLNAWRREVTK